MNFRKRNELGPLEQHLTPIGKKQTRINFAKIVPEAPTHKRLMRRTFGNPDALLEMQLGSEHCDLNQKPESEPEPEPTTK